jgi:hypothetical protein
MQNTVSVRAWVPTRQIPPALALRGPGQLGRDGAESILIFNASQSGRGVDLVKQFYAEEITGLDWLEDYLRDPATTHLVHDLLTPQEEEEEQEEFMLKSMVLSVEPDEV